MNHNFENSHSDLIYLFLDREASPLEQEILFKALSENSDLRAEFENALEIYSGFKSDKNNLNPPVHLATSIFSTAGMTYPNGYYSPSTSKVISSRFFPKIKNFLKPVMFLFLGALLTFFFFTSSNNNEAKINGTADGLLNTIDFDQNQFNLINNYFANNNSQKIISDFSNVPVVKNFSGAFTQSYESEGRFISKPEPETNLFDKINNSNFNFNHNNFSSLKFSETINPVVSLVNKNFGNIPALFINEPQKNPEFYFEIRGNSGINQFPVSAQKFSINQIYQNLGMGLYYKIGKNNLVGAFIGNEPFSIYRVNDTEYINEFTPISNILTFGASYRQFIPVFDFNGYLAPFIDVATGFSEFGVITKGSVGLNLNPNNFLNFVVGMDGSMLFYKFKGNIQTTEKISIFVNFGFNL